MFTQIFSYIGNALKSLNDSRGPFKAGDLVEVREEIEYVEVKTPDIKREDINYINIGDKIMEWLRLKWINKLDRFISYLNLD
ncbi:6271_t:CDS:2, partial [Entrophospora sp. SA101]